MSNKTPLSQYQALVSANEISYDAAQKEAVELLQQLYLKLLPEKQQASHEIELIKGVYLWGKVGRGKTFLMDLFVDCLADAHGNELCKRQHFHHFMKDVHHQLKALTGKSEPLKRIAKQFSQQYRVLCFDEFFVSDIGDAMLLGNLLQFMFEMNIVVVSTSNCAPKELYRNGLQRERFLPAIAAIMQYTQPLALNGQQDHRLRTLTYVQHYFELPQPIEQQVALHQGLLEEFFLPVSSDQKQINILGREIPYIAKSKDKDNYKENEKGETAICFDFSSLCQGPRSHFDYIELAKTFDTILLFNVPPLSGQAYERIKARGTEDNGSNINMSAASTGEREVVLAPMDDAVRRFIALVDECYDCHIKLVITAFVAQEKLYNSGALMFEFERTKSRLIEMASKEYLDAKSI